MGWTVSAFDHLNRERGVHRSAIVRNVLRSRRGPHGFAEPPDTSGQSEESERRCGDVVCDRSAVSWRSAGDPHRGRGCTREAWRRCSTSTCPGTSPRSGCGGHGLDDRKGGSVGPVRDWRLPLRGPHPLRRMSRRPSPLWSICPTGGRSSVRERWSPSRASADSRRRSSCTEVCSPSSQPRWPRLVRAVLRLAHKVYVLTAETEEVGTSRPRPACEEPGRQGRERCRGPGDHGGEGAHHPLRW